MCNETKKCDQTPQKSSSSKTALYIYILKTITVIGSNGAISFIKATKTNLMNSKLERFNKFLFLVFQRKRKF
ncbi:hypothetical protein B0A70_10120 [Chryseobacterium piscicola]|uniref:Uncharacterized protein n=1 Tax=Chryseobacterium piscicola TaxID=551459 RepID=A0A2S7KE37_9FLAO|nr:hypothetical protein B0A70_10120 [Chryseobacterium piscicola]